MVAEGVEGSYLGSIDAVSLRQSRLSSAVALLAEVVITMAARRVAEGHEEVAPDAVFSFEEDSATGNIKIFLEPGVSEATAVEIFESTAGLMREAFAACDADRSPGLADAILGAFARQNAE